MAKAIIQQPFPQQTQSHIAELWYQMARNSVEPHQANHSSARRQTRHRARPNTDVLPAAANSQFEGHGESTPQQVMDVVGPVTRLQDPHHIDIAYHGVVDYHPQPLGDGALPYVFPNVGLGQGVLPQLQPNVTENRGHVPFGYGIQNPAPGPAQAAFPGPFAHDHRMPAQGQPAREDLRRLASRYMHHPDSQVDMVRMEPHASGRCKVVIILETANVLAIASPEAQLRWG
ncbi:hypothetical protein BJV74DRAFT_888758 [Russula compacta]|nr:hypothetical protein BJV74DRAFT_888758 [Russula compacta]